MIDIGPYRFTKRDAHRLLDHGVELIDLITGGRSPSAVEAAAPHRERVAALPHGFATPARAPDVALVWAEWRAAMEAVRSTGAFGPPAVGTATGLFRGAGGVPKHRAELLEVGFGGVVGDRQAERRHHGAPFQALCLWSTESIDHFRTDGHPIAPGLAGENVSITGLPWDRVRPGVRLQIGDVLAEVSSYAEPCKKNAAWFLGGRFDLMHHRKTVHTRLYATVLEPGIITAGAPVLLEPGPSA
ncbi:MAG: hypothetical protein JWO68_1000 [Actinomycetia bacterium]|nr:hypothetical protein [Actinomycetes bacterium]